MKTTLETSEDVNYTRNEWSWLQNGAGGSYTWGKPEDTLNPAPAAIDNKDPNYDSDQDVRNVTRFWNFTRLHSFCNFTRLHSF